MSNTSTWIGLMLELELMSSKYNIPGVYALCINM